MNPKKNRAASTLGKRAKGKRKTLTEAALKQRRAALATARARRHPKPLDEHAFQLPPGMLPFPSRPPEEWDDDED